MKKIVMASTALTMLAGAASAEVTVVGSGYFGLMYNSKPAAGVRTTTLLDRFQVELKASKTTDSGLTFFGKFRIRSNQYQAGATPVNAGQVGVKAGGLSVAVGNVSDAIDAMATYYNSEIGICGCGGEVLDWNFDGYSSQGAGNNGVLATYTMGAMTVNASYQSHGNTTATKGSTAISGQYKTDQFSVELGYVNNAALAYQGTVGVFEYYMGKSTIGVAVGHNSGVHGTVATLYGSTAFGATTVSAFVSQLGNLAAGDTTKTTYGIGGAYDLGSGAAIVGSIRSTTVKSTYADLGVKFKF